MYLFSRVSLLNLSLKTDLSETEIPTAAKTAESSSADVRCAGIGDLQAALQALGEAFGEPFAVVDVESGDLVHSDYEGLSCDLYDRIELLAEVSRRGQPEIIEEVAPLAMLAIPLRKLGIGATLVAVGVFVTQQITDETELAAASRAFGVDARRALRWSTGRMVWPPAIILRLATTNLENLVQREQLSRLTIEAAESAAHAEDIYAELDLLHRLTGHLHLSESEHELWQNALGWLSSTIPAQCLGIVLRGVDEREITPATSQRWEVLTEGESPVAQQELCALLCSIGLTALRQPVLLNRAETNLPTWHCPTIRELACVPIENGDQPRGWLVALNHRGDAQASFHEFGSVEVQLLSSVGTILGIHNSNLGLYRQQSELFASSVQALTSAIDAKDGYTSGHSDRVAFYSVALAKQMGLSKTDCDTLYLAGLLHDIGKIGIDDQVLNKPAQLTAEEYEHIKRHPQLGYDILKGVRQLDKVLPIVLHHHEAWDGSGYPHGLKATETPQMARIVAVADAFDAMSSDRSYRAGMADEKVDSILRSGAGKQWDAEVINAFFDVRDEITRIADASANV